MYEDLVSVSGMEILQVYEDLVSVSGMKIS